MRRQRRTNTDMWQNKVRHRGMSLRTPACRLASHHAACAPVQLCSEGQQSMFSQAKQSLSTSALWLLRDEPECRRRGNSEGRAGSIKKKATDERDRGGLSAPMCHNVEAKTAGMVDEKLLSHICLESLLKAC